MNEIKYICLETNMMTEKKFFERGIAQLLQSQQKFHTSILHSTSIVCFLYVYIFSP